MYGHSEWVSVLPAVRDFQPSLLMADHHNLEGSGCSHKSGSAGAAAAGSGAQHTPVLRAPADLLPSGYMGETTKHSLSWHKTSP